MTSGIYKLTFGNKYIYIGKSNDIERRWKEHWDKFATGKAAKNMQAAFIMYGYPSREVIYACHEDHIDIVEPYFIAINRTEYSLNTVFPSVKEQIEYDRMFRVKELLELPTSHHCQLLVDRHYEVETLKKELEDTRCNYENEIEEIKSGTVVPQLEDQIEVLECCISSLVQDIEERDKKIKKLKNRGFWERLFND